MLKECSIKLLYEMLLFHRSIYIVFFSGSMSILVLSLSTPCHLCCMWLFTCDSASATFNVDSYMFHLSLSRPLYCWLVNVLHNCISTSITDINNCITHSAISLFFSASAYLVSCLFSQILLSQQTPMSFLVVCSQICLCLFVDYFL